MKKVIIICMISALLLPAGCKEAAEQPTGGTDEPKFYTPEKEGRWSGKWDTHTPVVRFLSRDTIEVEVPLQTTKTPIHYIEAIVLMKGDRQVDVKKFSFTFMRAKAVFTLPDPDASDYWVVAKCNLHDMWKEDVMR